MGNWYIKRNLRTYSLIWTWFLGCRCMQPSSWNASNAKGFESWKLCNAHDILSYFCDFYFYFFLWKTQIDCLFLKDMITHETSSYLFCNLFGDSLRVYVLFDLVTWQFWSDGNGAVCHSLVCDQVKLSWFKIVEWWQGSVGPAETRWPGLIPKEFI